MLRKILALLALLFLGGASAFAQGALAAPQVALKTVNGYTMPIAAATITVCAAKTGGLPCSPALSGALYQDIGLTEPLSNPFTADANGNYQFAALANSYTVTVTAPGFSGYSYQLAIGTGSGGGGGLSDPGTNGLVYRYQPDGTAIASALNVFTPLGCADTSGSGAAQSCLTFPTFTPQPNVCVAYTTTTANSSTGLTLNVNASSAASIAIAGASGWTTTLTAGIIPANKPMLACYDGTNWDVQQTGTAATGSGGGPGTCTQNYFSYWSSTSVLGCVGSAISGQIPVVVNGAAPMISSPSLTDSSSSPVSTTPYTVQCDSATTIIDRAHVVRFQSGASAITVPLSTGTGCAGLATRLIDDGAGTLTVSRTSPDTFSIYNGSTNSDGQTSFTLSNGQYATISQAASGIWEVTITSSGSGGSGTVNAGTTTGDCAVYPSATNAVSDTNIPCGNIVLANSTVGASGLWSNGFPRGDQGFSSGTPVNGNSYVQQLTPIIPQVVGHATFNVSTCASCAETAVIGVYTSTSSAAVWCGSASVTAPGVYSPSATQYTLQPNTRYYILYGQSGTTAAVVSTYAASALAGSNILTQNNPTFLAIAANGVSGSSCPSTLGTLTSNVTAGTQVGILLEP
jgi:hypothetical protein